MNKSIITMSCNFFRYTTRDERLSNVIGPISMHHYQASKHETHKYVGEQKYLSLYRTQNWDGLVNLIPSSKNTTKAKNNDS